MKSEIVERIIRNIPLETRLKVHLQMSDYVHWNDGEYSGNVNEELEYLLNIIEEWQKNWCFAKKQYKKNITYYGKFVL